MQTKKTNFCTPDFTKNLSFLKKRNKNTLTWYFWQQNSQINPSWIQMLFQSFPFFLNPLFVKPFYLSGDLLLRTIQSQVPEICLACNVVYYKLHSKSWCCLCLKMAVWDCHDLHSGFRCSRDSLRCWITLWCRYICVCLYKHIYLKGWYIVKRILLTFFLLL